MIVIIISMTYILMIAFLLCQLICFLKANDFRPCCSKMQENILDI